MGSDSNLAKGVLEEWDLERRFYGDKVLYRLCQSWEIPTVLSVLYLIMVFGGQHYMKNRNSFKLRSVMFVWSSVLSLFSIIGAYRMSVIGIRTLQKNDIYFFLCDQTYFDSPVTRVWAALFAYSKFFEYFDTTIIIMRKQSLIFLHWYHHLTVALFCWLMYGGRYAGGFPFAMLNYIVHAFMYTYYAVRAAGYRPPRFVSVTITFMQIVQMVFGCLIMGAVVFWANPSQCASSTAHSLSGCFMYFSYLVLFLHFFYGSYLKRRKDIKITKQSSRQNDKLKNEVHTAEMTSQHFSNESSVRKRNFRTANGH